MRRDRGRNGGARSVSSLTLAAVLVTVACAAIVQIGTLGGAGAAPEHGSGRNGGSPPGRTGGSPPSRTSVPTAPTAVTAVAGPASATITWTAPASDGGSRISGYRISPSSGSSVTVGVVSDDVITGLVDGTVYTFTVAAVNAVGTGPASAPSNPVTPVAAPAKAAAAFLLPLYDSSSADWLSACTDVAGTDSFVVADIGNPGGPGTSVSPTWASNIADCGTSHVGVLGYVDTGYCQVPLSTVESQIDAWYSWYGPDGVDGIFFDEADNPSNPTSTSDCLARSSSAVGYYQTIAAYVHAKAAGQTVTFNFGDNPLSSWPLASTVAGQNADIIVIFEDPYSDYVNYGGSGAWAPASWEAGYAAQHFSLLVYGASGSNLPSAFCSAVSSQNVGSVYITPTSGWVTLPNSAYLSSEVAEC
ncbi:MAG: spherulation-specific family 4 protein [Acidimicrobiales bacterium]